MVTNNHSINMHNSSLQFFHLSAMPTAEKLVSNKKLKIVRSQARTAVESIDGKSEKSCQKFPSVVGRDRQRILGNACSGSVTVSSHSRGINGQSSLNGGSAITTVPNEKRAVEMTKIHKNTDNNHSCRFEMSIAANSKGESFVTHASKREPPRRLDSQKGKKQRINSNVMQQCAATLKKLMIHPAGWVFNQPVDPVKLNIPDYFSVISEPMDLGTIKSKLEKKLYSDTREFAADVRLTFSNAMLYNPPSNKVHIMAKELYDIFVSNWKILEAKWNGESLKFGQQLNSNERPKKAQNSRQNFHKTPASCLNSLPKMSMTSAQKQKLRKDLTEISKGKIPPHLLDVFRKFGLISQNEERIEVDIDAFDEDAAWELLRVLRSCRDSRFVESADTENSCGRDFLEDRHKGIDSGNRSAHSSVNVKSRASPVACINGFCGSMNCQCSRHNDFTQASSGIDSEGSLGRDNKRARHGVLISQGPLTNDVASRRVSKSDHDSDGAVSAVDEEHIEPISCPTIPATAAASEEGLEWQNNVYDGQLSPNKALRAAMLRSRFADTILKAQQKTLLNNGEKGDPVRMQQEKERLEKQQRQEKARIEAQIRAAEAASRMREEAELKMQREKEREAARIALQKMEKTVQIDENVWILKDLEMLGGFSQSDHLTKDGGLEHRNVDGIELELGAFEGGCHGNPLERLGLFMKDEYMDEEEEVAGCVGDVEEGEIAS